MMGYSTGNLVICHPLGEFQGEARVIGECFITESYFNPIVQISERQKRNIVIFIKTLEFFSSRCVRGILVLILKDLN
jgi:hypothetical protein